MNTGNVYFNTAFSLAMVTPPTRLEVEPMTEDQARDVLSQSNVKNVANPGHANTLAALSQKLDTDLRDAKGGRIALEEGDVVIVGQVRFPPSVPRETTEYSDEQLALGTFEFLKVTIS